MQNKLRDKQWFIDRIGKVVYRDSIGCNCDVCSFILKKGLKILGEEQCQYLWEIQNDLAQKGLYLNYRDEK